MRKQIKTRSAPAINADIQTRIDQDILSGSSQAPVRNLDWRFWQGATGLSVLGQFFTKVLDAILESIRPFEIGAGIST